MPIAHAQFACKRILPLFAYDDCIRGAFRILVNPMTGGSQPLGGILTNLYLSVSSVTVPSWRRGFLAWHVENVSVTYRICILRTSLSGWSFLFMMYANCGAIAVITSTTYMTIVELFGEYSAPFSPEVIRSLIMTPTSTCILNDIILTNETERSSKACCWGE